MPKEALDALYRWHSATDFAERVKALRPSVAELYDAKYRLWREALVIARYAEHVSAQHARLLVPVDDAPDGQIETDSGVINVEVTQAMEPDRKPRLEAKSAGDYVEEPGEVWAQRSRAITESVNSRIQDKRTKRYAKTTTLLVYLTIEPYTLDAGIEDALRAAIATHRHHFGDLRIYWRKTWF